MNIKKLNLGTYFGINFGTKGMKTLLALIVIGFILIAVRFLFGLGAVTNLSDGYPWGLWIGVDVITGVALAAGGFTIAAIVHIFGMEKYHGVIRPAILTAFLGYVFVAFGVVLDLGRGWNIWHIIFFWNHSSAMFEVGWCVLLYLTVLAIEFLPVVFEEYKLSYWQAKYDLFAPWISIVLISWFVFVMTGVPWFAFITFIVLAVCWLLFQTMLPKGSTVILLIMAGIILSVQHQSSLGTIFLLTPTKLASLWYTPFLPLNFLLSAIMVGLAMVIFESTISSRVFGFGLEEDVIRGLSKWLSLAIIITACVKFLSLFLQTGINISATIPQIIAFILEVAIGYVVPFLMLVFSGKKITSKTSFYAATMVVIGLLLNRINVAIVGMTNPTHPVYIPHIGEILITVGVISTGLLAFYIMCTKLPVFEKKHI